MTDPHKTFGQHMYKEPPDEFHAGQRKFFPTAFIAVIFDRKSNRIFIHADDPVVAYGYPVCIFAKITDYRLCTIKSLFAVRNPFGGITAVNQFFELISVPVF